MSAFRGSSFPTGDPIVTGGRPHGILPAKTGAMMCSSQHELTLEMVGGRGPSERVWGCLRQVSPCNASPSPIVCIVVKVCARPG